MEEFVVINTGTYIQYRVIKEGDEYKVYGMSGHESKVSYAEIERGLISGQYKKM